MRSNKIVLIVGGRNAGKTSFVKKLNQASVQPKKLIVDIFDNPVWENLKTWDHPEWENISIPILPLDQLPSFKFGLARIFDSDTDLLQNEVDLYVRNTFVTFEDASRYFDSRLNKLQKRYLLNSKQTNNDIALVFHFLSQVAPEIVKIADYLVLFKTNESFFDEKKYFHPEIKKAFEHLRKSKNPHENVTIQLQ